MTPEPSIITRARKNWHGFQKRDRVTVSGAGRTATWDQALQGTVTQWTGRWVYVRWDGTSFEDQMQPQELRHVEKGGA